jgi:hypothetical protein
MKSWLIVLALAGASIASAKNYAVTITQPFVVGSTTLTAGDYKLDLEGSKVLFLDSKNKTVAQASVKVENEQKKYGGTIIESKMVGDQKRITVIGLAGTSMKLLFD